MSKEVLKRLLVKGTVSYLAVFLLILTVAVPAMAVLAADSVNSAAIINGQVKTKDIAKRAVTAKKIALGAVRSAHIKDGSIQTADVASIADSKISYSTKTRHLSIPGDAFVPELNGFDYVSGRSSVQMETGAFGAFTAPISLPDGATVTNIRFNYYDNAAAYLDARVQRRPLLSNVVHVMTDFPSTVGALPEWRSLDDNTISFPAIDNENYFYSASIVFNGTASYNLKAGGLIITYQIAGP